MDSSRWQGFCHGKNVEFLLVKNWRHVRLRFGTFCMSKWPWWPHMNTADVWGDASWQGCKKLFHQACVKRFIVTRDETFRIFDLKYLSWNAVIPFQCLDFCVQGHPSIHISFVMSGSWNGLLIWSPLVVAFAILGDNLTFLKISSASAFLSFTFLMAGSPLKKLAKLTHSPVQNMAVNTPLICLRSSRYSKYWAGYLPWNRSLVCF